MHGCRRRKDAIVQALTAAPIDVDAVMAGDGNLVNALVGQQIVEGTAASQLSERHLAKRFAL